jgi:hypothetical protein
MHLLLNILMTYRSRSLCGIGDCENGAGVVGHKVQEHSFPSFGSAVQRFIDVVDQWKCQDNGGGVGIVAVAVLTIITAKYNIGENGLRKKGALNLVQKKPRNIFDFFYSFHFIFQIQRNNTIKTHEEVLPFFNLN